MLWSNYKLEGDIMRFLWVILLLCFMPLQVRAEIFANHPLGYSEDALKKMFEQVMRTGVGVDGIPSLYRPQQMSVSEASLSLDDSDVVFIVHFPEGHTRIYPQRIMVWHEVVNDVIPDGSGSVNTFGEAETEAHSYTISYSPLTGSVIAFRSLAGNYHTTFGNTGDLLNANSILYDRISVSMWSQLLALCIEGPFKGKRLERVQVIWATWGGVKKKYNGKADVLSSYTGIKRPYGKDPYGSYHRKGTYYDDVRIMHPVAFIDKRLPPKKRILGIEEETLFGAVQVDEVKKSGYLNFSLGFRHMVALYDADIDAVRVFDRRLPGEEEPLIFTIFEGNFVDEKSKSQWSADGNCFYGRHREKKLTPIYTMDSMWFAWAAFYKQTKIFPYNQANSF